MLLLFAVLAVHGLMRAPLSGRRHVSSEEAGGDVVRMADLISALAAVFSAITAGTAIFFTYRSERRAREVTKAQIYLTLRQNFIDIYRELGDLEEGGDPQAQLKLVRQAYWHHAFDEWYVSRLAPRELGDLWPEFFRVANESGLRHPPLRKAFDRLRADSETGFGAYAGDFIKEVLRYQNLPTSQRPQGEAISRGVDRQSDGDDPVGASSP